MENYAKKCFILQFVDFVVYGMTTVTFDRLENRLSLIGNGYIHSNSANQKE